LSFTTKQATKWDVDIKSKSSILKTIELDVGGLLYDGKVNNAENNFKKSNGSPYVSFFAMINEKYDINRVTCERLIAKYELHDLCLNDTSGILSPHTKSVNDTPASTCYWFWQIRNINLAALNGVISKIKSCDYTGAANMYSNLNVHGIPTKSTKYDNAVLCFLPGQKPQYDAMTRALEPIYSPLILNKKAQNSNLTPRAQKRVDKKDIVMEALREACARYGVTIPPIVQPQSKKGTGPATKVKVP
jgi:hypothetical protein